MSQPSENIIDELKSISPRLARIDRSNAFRVPAGYFSKLPQDVFAKLNIAEHNSSEPLTSPKFPESHLAVPPGYFESLADNVFKKIADNELEDLPEYITALRKENPFKVPSGYFDNLTETIILRHKQGSLKRTKPKIFRLFNPKLALVAAAFVGIVLTVFFLQETNQPADLVKISSDDVIEYMADNLEDFDDDELMPLVDGDHLNEFEAINLLEEDIQEYLNDEDIEYELNEIL